jgi:hypothetical protein
VSKILVLILLSFLNLFALAQKLPNFDTNEQPDSPDYQLSKNLSALPFRVDVADVIPKGENWINDAKKEIDVFYIYPTMYLKGKTWNADLSNKKLNKSIDNYPVKFHASVFNHVARVYAPRYRQSIAKVWDNPEEPNHKASLDFAYEDVKNAFEYYLKNYNNGRPFIIASHSQGSYHGIQLLKDYFEDGLLQKQLVAAYLIGYGIDSTFYDNIDYCKTATDNNCYITWASFRHNYEPKESDKKLNSLLYTNVCINPITWNNEKKKIDSQLSEGGIMLSLKQKKKRKNSAEIAKENFLRVKTKYPVVRLPFVKVYHVLDYNLFWFDIRKNAMDRSNVYLKK